MRWLTWLILNKYLLLVVATIPLAWVAYDSARHMAEARQLNELRVTAAAEADETVAPCDLSQDSELLRAVLAVAEQAGSGTLKDCRDETRVAEAIQIHAKTLHLVDQFFRQFADLKYNSRSLPDDEYEFRRQVQSWLPATHPLYGPLENRFRVARAESDVIQERLQAQDTVQMPLEDKRQTVAQRRARLDEYRLLQGYSEEFWKLESAELTGYELRFVETQMLSDILQGVFGFESTPDAIDEAQQKIDARQAELQAYSDAFGETGKHSEWVFAEAKRWHAASVFVKRYDQVKELSIDRQIEAIGDLLHNAETPTLLKIGVEAASYLCESQFPLKIAYDTKVLIFRDANDPKTSQLVDRSQIVVVWDDYSMEWFEKCSFSEFDAPRDRLKRLIVVGLGTQRPILDGTPVSQAAWTYNRLRQNIQWTKTDIERLYAECEPHQEHLGQDWERIAKLHAAAQKHPQLFQTLSDKSDMAATNE